MSSETLHVPLGRQAYDIIIGRTLLSKAAHWLEPVLPAKRAIIISDEEVAEYYLPLLQEGLINAGFTLQNLSVAPGEHSKSFDAFEALMERLLTLSPDRKTTLIALGGGVVGDLTGFAASVLLRGVPLVQIPTTLLAQVDSSVGGKTGINTGAGKNLVGSFYQPRRVLIDTDTLKSLPDRQMKAGYAEIVKYAMLGDDGFMHWLEQNGEKLLARNELALSHAIKLCLSMKAELVEWDVREQNMRALLNFGHTFGHALETEVGYDGRLLHGEAVAIGMVMAAQLSAQLGRCDADVGARLVAHLKAVGLPTSPHDIAGVDWDTEAICSHFAQDKKAEDGKLAFVLLNAIGDADLVRDVSPEAARKVVEHFVN